MMCVYVKNVTKNIIQNTDYMQTLKILKNGF